jgi:hypothetical protein
MVSPLNDSVLKAQLKSDVSKANSVMKVSKVSLCGPSNI